MKKKALVLHSGGMDSSICLRLAINEFGCDEVLSVGFRYSQRHSNEIEQADKISSDWGCERLLIDLPSIPRPWKNSALVNENIKIEHLEGELPNTFVVGRNGLMLQMTAILAFELGASIIYTGVIQADGANSGYPDCSRKYINCIQDVARLDLMNDTFEIRTPIIELNKCETLELANSLGYLNYLLENTISCYEGTERLGCRYCPACQLRNEGILNFHKKNPNIVLPYYV